MIRFVIYLIGLLVVVAAVGLMLLQFQDVFPAMLVVGVVLLVLGLGIIGAAYWVREPAVGEPRREVVETRRRIE